MSSRMDRRDFLKSTVGRILPSTAPDPAESACRWMQEIVDFVSRPNVEGNLVLGLPEFRPDIVDQLAALINYRVFDFRAEVMSKRSWQAHEITLDELTECLRAEAATSKIVAFNVEALLSTKSAVERENWFRLFRKEPFANRAIAIATLYCELLEPSDPGVLIYELGTMPEHGLLHRMLEVKLQTPKQAQPVLVLDS